MNSFSIAHISDLHFGKFCLNPLQFFSKRWVGNLNFLFNRRKSFSVEGLDAFIDFLQEKGFQKVFITGDFSTTGRREEFSEGKIFCEKLEKKGLSPLCIPGNHDYYTKENEREKEFYTFLQNPKASFFSLKEDGIELTPLCGPFWVLALDTCFATSLFSAKGLFSEKIEKKLEEALSLVPEGAKIIMLNHFPLFCNDTESKALIRREALQKILQKNQMVALYLSGHTHRSAVADLRERGWPILINAGSLTYKKRSSFNAIHFSEESIEVEVFEKKEAWEVVRKDRFSLLKPSI